jgi:predicted Zn-dependent protease
MTVRWKPLIFLCALFLVTAVVGLLAIGYALVPGRPADLLSLARNEWKQGQYERAQIQFRRALQADEKNAKIYEGLARMYAEWAEHSPVERPKLLPLRLRALADAAKYDRQATEPRRLLLAEALTLDEWADAAHWAQELLAIDPRSADSHFALGSEAIAAEPPRIVEARAHLESLQVVEPDSIRSALLGVDYASLARDETGLSQALEHARLKSLSEKATLTDRLAMLRIRVLDVQAARDRATLAERVKSFRDEAGRLASESELSPLRIARLGRMLETVQKHLSEIGTVAEADKTARDELSKSLDALAEAIYSKALAASETPDLRIYQAYAEHLLFRGNRDQCLEIVRKALRSPMASLPAWTTTAMQLREIGIKAALSESRDPARFDQASPFLKELMSASDARHQALGHLFQGVIDLERSGLAEASAATPGLTNPTATVDVKLRASALAHLKKAAAGLTDVGAAQALYGVALLLTQEPALGRQYLLNAQRLGNLEPRYQIWAAWSMVQAGYPEEAEPIVTKLLEGVSQAKLPRDLEGILHLVNGEIHQLRRSPQDLRIARAEYEKAIRAGQPENEALQLRMAQVDVGLGQPEAGARRIEAVKSGQQGGPAAEHLMVLLLLEQGKKGEARKALDDARRRFPDNDELLGLDVSLLFKAGRADEADKLLAEFLAKHPSHLDVVLLRARVLSAKPLLRFDEARKLLTEVADRSDTSAPTIQLALLELSQGRFEATEQVIAKVRSRWKESAAGDLLDAQLALARDNPRGAASFLDAALKKDPTNKVAKFWKAQLEEKVGAFAEAAKIYDDLAREKPVKEIEQGLTLADAAKWALATQALGNQDFEAAINKYQELLKSVEPGDLARALRWQVAAAKAAKGDWPAAKAEIDALVKDPKTSHRERVQAANLYRMNKEEKAARDQLNIVLAAEPANSQAVAVAAFLLAEAKRPADAAALIRKAIAAGEQPPSIYLMLSAIEDLAPPKQDAPKRALAAIDEGLKVHPDSVEMVRAKAMVVRLSSGDPLSGLAVVEERAKNDLKDGRFRRLLADFYRDLDLLPKALDVVRGLLKEHPDDERLMTTLIRLLAAEAVAAGQKGNRALEHTINDETARLLARFRAARPKDLALAEAECDLAARRGDMGRASVISEEIDKIDPNSPVGPLLRARIEAARGDGEAVARAYDEAISRAPRRLDLHLALGQASLALNKPDEALRQAQFVLEAEKDRPAAVILKARALVSQAGTPAQAGGRRAQAISILQEAAKNERTLAARTSASSLPREAALHEQAAAELSRLVAEIQIRGRDRGSAIGTLKGILQQTPGDENTLAMLTQILVGPRDGAPQAPAQDVQDAMALAEQYGGADPRGNLCLALAVGFHKAGRFDLALPWAEKAAQKLDLPVVHLNYGDILLTKAEATSEETTARGYFEKAVEQYDLVLNAQANSVEATNNKAWILHRYLNQNAEALRLAEELARRSDPSTLPGEFYDTLGSIQEAAGRRREAEDAYERGLKKTPEHPVLNYHMGRLMARDRDRKDQAARYLEKAREGKSRLSPAMADEVETLLKEVGA